MDADALRRARRSAIKAKTFMPCSTCVVYGNRCNQGRPCTRCTKLSRECSPLVPTQRSNGSADFIQKSLLTVEHISTSTPDYSNLSELSRTFIWGDPTIYPQHSMSIQSTNGDGAQEVTDASPFGIAIPCTKLAFNGGLPHIEALFEGATQGANPALERGAAERPPLPGSSLAAYLGISAAVPCDSPRPAERTAARNPGTFAGRPALGEAEANTEYRSVGDEAAERIRVHHLGHAEDGLTDGR